MIDLAQAINARADWTIDGDAGARYAPPSSRWSAQVRRTRVPGRALDRLYISIIDSDGIARFTYFASTAAEAIRVAEARVRAKQQPS